MNGYENPDIIETNIVEAAEALLDSDPRELARELRALIADLHAARRYWYGA
jgi:hypothetical protein